MLMFLIECLNNIPIFCLANFVLAIMQIVVVLKMLQLGKTILFKKKKTLQ